MHINIYRFYVGVERGVRKGVTVKWWPNEQIYQSNEIRREKTVKLHGLWVELTVSTMHKPNEVRAEPILGPFSSWTLCF